MKNLKKFIIDDFPQTLENRLNEARFSFVMLVQFGILLIITVGFYSCEYDPVLNPSMLKRKAIT